MADTTVRFELGFRGGGSTGGTISEAEWTKLEGAISSGSPKTVELTGTEHSWMIRVEEVAFARRVAESGRRLGFSG